MKTLQMQKTPSGQYRYRIYVPIGDLGRRVVVDWQYGPYSWESTILQAQERFLGTQEFHIECNRNPDPSVVIG
jgi:hypothetical protein